MHPSVKADRPGQCPICGMDLTPVEKKDRASESVFIDAEGMRWIGARLAAVERRPLERRIAGLGHVVERGATARAAAWIDAQVYEADPSALAIGRGVVVAAPSQPLTRFEGFIALALADPEGGATRLRVVVDDPGRALAPGAQADVEIDVVLSARLVVPDRAVIHAGSRRLVFVDRGRGRLEPRQLRTGVRAGGLVEVLGGVSEGERVVVSGTFLVAAESRLGSAGSLWSDAP